MKIRSYDDDDIYENNFTISFNNNTDDESFKNRRDSSGLIILLVILCPLILYIIYMLHKMSAFICNYCFEILKECKYKCKFNIFSKPKKKNIRNFKLTKQFINCLKKNNCVNVYIQEKCCICFSELEKDILVLNCKHRLHKKCLQKWVTSQLKNFDTNDPNCPMCRKSIINSNFQELNHE